jgi:hypothetical protein
MNPKPKINPPRVVWRIESIQGAWYNSLFSTASLLSGQSAQPSRTTRMLGGGNGSSLDEVRRVVPPAALDRHETESCSLSKALDSGSPLIVWV